MSRLQPQAQARRLGSWSWSLTLMLMLLSLLALTFTSTFTLALSSTATQEISSQEHALDGPVEDIQWADLQNVFVITRMGTLYHSDNGGRTFVNQMSRIPDGMHHVSSMYISEHDPHRILFTGRNKQNFHTLDMGSTFIPCPQIDIQDVRLHPTQKDWLLASAMAPGCNAEHEAAGEDAQCYKILYLSKDFGLTWSSILTYVVQFDWSLPSGDMSGGATTEAHRPSDEIIYVTAHEQAIGNQVFGVWDKQIHFYSSKDFFQSKRVLVPHGNRFLFGEYGFIFVAAVDPTEESRVSLQIARTTLPHHLAGHQYHVRGAGPYISVSGNPEKLKFHTAMLPPNIHLTEHSYTILDTSEGQVFLHVNHLPFTDNAYAGHVYTSDWSGLKYSLSLPYNHRASDGKCDFEKVEGLEGVYLANFIDEELMEDEEEKEEQALGHQGTGHYSGIGGRGAGKRVRGPIPKRERLRTKTVISWDKGGEWSYLVPPSHDSHGEPIQCTGECHLHLHGVTDPYGPFYSAASATGLIMGTGVIGSYLQQHPDAVNTFLSRDAGLTWFEVAKGSHIYEYGNHGALIAMAPDNRRTDSILYSFDEGATWITHRITDRPFQVENIIIEPEANSHQFLVYGFREEGGVVIYVDFEALHERECVGHDRPDASDSDYERWTPSDRRLNGKCLLGRTVTYVRRKRLAACNVPEAFQHPVAAENCPCTIQDFDCDYGYERKKIDFGHTEETEGNLACVPMASMPAHANPLLNEELQQQPCSHGQSTYFVTRGYRRVPGDTCYGGAQWDPVEVQCPGWLSSGHTGKVIFVIMILLALSLIVVMIGSKRGAGGAGGMYGSLHDQQGFLGRLFSKIRDRFSQAKYKIVGHEAAPHSMVDDEAFYLSEDEFGPSPHLLDGGESGSGDARSRHIQSSSSSSATSSSIRPLPTSTKAKSPVPSLAPPSH